MKLRFRDQGLLLSIAGLLLVPIALVGQQPLSHVRVVRLSYVSGRVAVKQPGATEWATALVNAPIQEGFELSTSAASFAEVEFENGSTARLGELSHLVFDQLALDAEGNKLNRMTFEQGYATFHFMPEKHDAYALKIAESTITPSGKVLFRTDLEQDHARVEVFNGSVQIVDGSESTKVGKDRMVEYNTGPTEVAFITQKAPDRDAWDKWADSRDTQANLALRDQAVALHGPMYGWSDLDTYGEWAFLPGFGYGWLPFAPMGWVPYSSGMWGWYPGWGSTWISGEPWGWLPYHYGAWNFSPGFGWFWMPGNFGYWSPALVSWYTGPGWVGWAPRGLSTRLDSIRAVTTVAGTEIQTGRIFTPDKVRHVGMGEGQLMARPTLQPGAGIPLAGTPFGAGPSLVAHAGGAHALAPSSILMGGESSRESALLGTGRMRQPLRVRMGTTLGGRYAVGGAVGEFRGQVREGMAGGGAVGVPRGSARGNGEPTLSVLPHGQSARPSTMGGGGMMRGGGGMVPGGGGGFPSGGMSPGASVSSGASSGAHVSSPGAGGGPRR